MTRWTSNTDSPTREPMTRRKPRVSWEDRKRGAKR